MRVLILGATGPTGQELVKQALDGGHFVNVLARSPDKLQATQADDDKLKVIKGDIFVYDDVKGAMTGCDAVLSAVGGRPALFGSCDVYSKSLDVVVKVMKELKIKRFIGVTAMGTTDHPNLPFLWRWVFKPTVMRHVVADMRLFEEKLVSEVGEDIDWTVVKPPRLLNTPLSGLPTVAQEGQIVSGVKTQISRADLAKFMLDCVPTSEWSRKLVSVAGGAPPEPEQDKADNGTPVEKQEEPQKEQK